MKCAAAAGAAGEPPGPRVAAAAGAGRALQELGGRPGPGFLALLTQFGRLSQRPFLENG